MRRIRSHKVCTLLSFLIVCFSSCQVKEDVIAEIKQDGPVTVGIATGGCHTRTSILPDGLSTVWTDSDRLAVWARNSSGEYTLSAQNFIVYAAQDGRAWFTSTLASAMPDDTYTYYASYPVPVSVNGTKAVFSLSSVQDGLAGGGDDILIAPAVTYGPLTPIHDPDDHDMMSLNMRHIMHHFRFFIPEGADMLEGEAIDKILLTFPEDVVGNVVADFTNPDAPISLEDGSKTVLLQLAEPLLPSVAGNIRYADAVLCPRSFSAGQSFSIKAYSATKVATADPVDLRGRSFAAGHSTPVKLLLTDVHNYCRIFVRIVENNLGEDLNYVTLTAPAGCRWGDNGSNVLRLSADGLIGAGFELEIPFEEESYYRQFSSKTINVEYDSEHVNTSVTYVMPNMGTSYSAYMDLRVPYLLYEDFSTVGNISSTDNYTGGSNAGSKNAVSFLNGWTGGRLGASAGKCIRIAARRETSARYAARVDSAPIIALKKPANLMLSFNYGINSQYGGIAIIMDGDVGQDVYIGYVTTSSALASGDDDGTFEGANHINAHEFSGSYDSTPNDGDFILHDVPTGLVRICWRNMSENRAGTTNTTNWFYLDNVRVSIAK